jgi:Na+-translocating ferredoxin:NAD+ oxidoreductase RNF subunit RnfB
MAKKAKISPKTRATVLARDNHVCRACGFGGSAAYAPFLDCDHVVAEAVGGATTVENLQCLCKACNVSKGSNSWAFKIRTQPEAEAVWAFNQKVIGAAFVADTAKRLKKLK